VSIFDSSRGSKSIPGHFFIFRQLPMGPQTPEDRKSQLIVTTMVRSNSIPVVAASSSSSSLNSPLEIESYKGTVEMGYSDDEGRLQIVPPKMDISSNDMKLVQRWKTIVIGVVRVLSLIPLLSSKIQRE
jgi:hypothetical protein